MKPDEAALLRDLAAPAFKVGDRRGRWAVRGVRFPHVVFFISAPTRLQGPAGFLMRTDCTGYSGIAPNSQLWNGGANAPLEEKFRPRKPAGGVMTAFSTWGPCLYHPIDRLARDHGQWPTQHPEMLWTADKEITFLLETVHAILNSSEYAGADLPASATDLPQEFVAQYLGVAA
jgi:hypothetical protein